MPEEKPAESPTPVPEPEKAAPAPPTSAPPEPPPAEDWATRFKYLLADFENFRKRAGKERDFVRQAAQADVIRSLLPTYEAAQRAREAVAKLPPSDPIRRGIDLLVREFSAFLELARVLPVARTGEPFRAEWHEAVAEAPPRDKVPEGSVLEIIQQGYRIENALIRPAKVVVARRPAPVSTEPAAAAAEGPGSTDSS